MQTFIGILLGGSFLAFLEFLIQRYDKKHDRFAEIKKSIEELRKDIGRIDAKGDRREAENRRVRILRFEDELQEERRHSKDSFDQVMNDITEYNQYCAKHPEFKNEQTVATASHITSVYHERLERHDFL
ncbi:MAG: hypothetical protein E7240_06540 [Lachnospiraceae bacterium]|nr:hypothetical protein [Lachnospiraceae bacterium]